MNGLLGFEIPDAGVVALITQLVAGLFGILTLILQAFLTRYMFNLHHSMNSMREELVKTTASDSEQKGMEKGVAQEKADQALRDKGAAKEKEEP
jgi:hypothetical protein